MSNQETKSNKELAKESLKKTFGWLNFKKYKKEISDLENRTTFVVEEETVEQPQLETADLIKEGEFSNNKRYGKKANKVRGINLFSLSYLLKRDCDKKYTYVNLLLHFLVAFLVIVLIGLIFKLDVAPVVTICVVYLLFGPSLIYFHYRKKYEKDLFSSCVRYIEQMLYSFTRKSKILVALEETRLVIDGKLGQAIDFARDRIRNGSAENRNIYSTALKEIEAILPCSRVKNLHEFLAEVENVGGRHSSALDIMLDDLREWDIRTNQFQQDQSVKGIGMLFSILMSLGTCLFMTNVLPADMGGDVSGFGLYQWITTIAIIIMFFIYRVAMRKLTRSWVVDDVEMDQEQIDKDQKAIAKYFETEKGVKPVLAIQRTKKELEKKFPRWIMRFALLASSQSVPMALRNSIDSCPNVMRAELEKLVEAIDAQPTSIEPYLNFFSYIDLPQIRSMMLMVYSLAEYGSSEIDKHVLSIVNRNYALQANSEKIQNEESLSRFSLFITLPMILACVIMMADVGMIVFNMLTTVLSDINF